MFANIVRRLLSVIPVFLGITIVCFLIISLLPGAGTGNALREIVSGSPLIRSRVFTAEDVEHSTAAFGFDRPVIDHYFKWLSGILTGDLGESFITQEPVFEKIVTRAPLTLVLSIAGLFLSFLICTALCIVASFQPALLFPVAARRKTIRDRVLGFIIVAGYAIPGFVLGLLLLLLFGGKVFSAIPHSGNDPGIASWFVSVRLHPQIIIFPVLCYAAGGFAFFAVNLRSSLFAELGKGYIKTALARGLDIKKAIMRHALRNALIPVFRAFGNFFSAFLPCAILVESIFRIPGIGALGYEAVALRDYPVTIGLVLVFSVFHLFVKLIVDICLAVADPLDRAAAVGADAATGVDAGADTVQQQREAGG